ncbi:MAG TPA: DinB family protein [Terriglobia bacterium]|nr:DinB family protein [Terriglobia bacterium]
MPFSEMLLPEFDQEMAGTRKTLERVPEEKFGWKPHDKSMTMLRLATLVAMMPGWAIHTINMDTLSLDGYQQPKVNSRQELLDLFDKNAREGRAAIAGATDEQLRKPWSMVVGGKTVFTAPKIDVLRSSVMNHLIHHRAQLGVFLRLNDIPVPAIYGPSADEGSF